MIDFKKLIKGAMCAHLTLIAGPVGAEDLSRLPTREIILKKWESKIRPENSIPANVCGVDAEACMDTGQLARFPDTVVQLCKDDHVLCSQILALQKHESTWRPAPQCAVDPTSCQGKFVWNGGQESTGQKAATANSLPYLQGNDVVAPLERNSDATGRIRYLAEDVWNSNQQPVRSIIKDIGLKLNRSDLSITRDRIKSSGLVCNNKDQRPAEFWREFLLRRSEVKSCSDAAGAIDGLRLETNKRYVAALGNTISSDRISAELSLFTMYRDKCLHSVAEAGRSALLDRSIGKNFYSKMLLSVGELSPPDKDYHCTASFVRLNDGVKLALVTAAHCVGDPTDGAGANRKQISSVNENMTFTNFSGQSFKVEIDKDVVGYQYDVRADVIYIPVTQNAIELDTVGFSVGAEPEIWDTLYLVGVNPFVVSINRATGKSPSLLEAATISLEPGCRVYVKDGSQIQYNCQTERGMSGSPIFTERNGEARLVAVHVGEAGPSTIGKCDASAARAVNVGSLLSP